MQPPAVPHVHGCCHISSQDYLFLCPLHWNFLRETGNISCLVWLIGLHLTFCTSEWRHVHTLLRQYSESPKLAKDLVPSVTLLPAGRGRGEKKQNRTSSDVSGEQLQPSSLPLGENAAEEAVSLSFYPPFSAPALLCSLWDMCSFIILLFPLMTLNQIASQSTLHVSC